MAAIATAAPAPNPREIVDQLIAEVYRQYPLVYSEPPAAAVDRLIAEVAAEYSTTVEVAR